MAECFDNETVECPLVDSCGLNATLHKALDAFFAVLEATTIADLRRPQDRQRLGLESKEIHKLAS